MKNKLLNHPNNKIEKLDNRLANQIAAGEVVDRPASVLKELMENSIDAGAKRIEVEIERGGTRLIKVTDDGVGISKDDLTLALTRHATSKIKSVEDLSAIYSLGFRGEALASISSVSRLTLTSRTHHESLAWQAISEGRDMQVKIQPASAMAGTRIEVRDLFFNTPARQKFLRTERTEFFQIEDVFKKIALAYFDVSLILKHNGKVVKRVPAVKLLDRDHTNRNNDVQSSIKSDTKKSIISEQEHTRLATLCGKAFSDLYMPIECHHEGISIQGFIGGENYHRSESDIQHVFINNRAVKDKTLSHAIKKAYHDRLPPGRMPTYIIYLTIDAKKIDVNVHPTKHEVRFENQRDVHDLLFHSITEALEATSIPKTKNDENIAYSSSSQRLNNNNFDESSQRKPSFKDNQSVTRRYSPELVYQQSHSFSHQDRTISDNFSSYQDTNTQELKEQISDVSLEQNSFDNGQCLGGSIVRLGKGFSLINLDKSAWLVDELLWLRKCFSKIIVESIKMPSIELLFPMVVDIDASELEECKNNLYLLNLGFSFSPTKTGKLSFNGVPVWSKSLDNKKIIALFSSTINLLNKNNGEMDVSKIIKTLFESEMIDDYLLNYTLRLNLFDFDSSFGSDTDIGSEDEGSDLNQCIKKIDAEMALNVFSDGFRNE